MASLGLISALVLAVALPIGVTLLLRSRGDREPWELALDIPAALAADLILTVLISRLVVLDVAVWAAKALWLAAGVAWTLRLRARGRRLQLPGSLLRCAPSMIALAVVGLAVSLWLSRRCAIWDRQWHIPFVTSLRGQRFPFTGVYEPWKELFYHFGGHVQAAALQTLSFGTLHSSYALSLVHDVSFVLLGLTVALVLDGVGCVRRVPVGILTLLAMLLSGPATTFYGDGGRPLGYSVVSFISVSFRPHVSLAALLMMPFLALPLARLRRLEVAMSPARLLSPLLVCAPALVIVDEFSLGVLGVGLGVVWLVRPAVLAPTRRTGLLMLGGLLAAVLVGVFFYKGTVGPGAPRYPVQFVFPQTPGFYTPPIPFGKPLGKTYFISDLLPMLGVAVGGALLLLRRRDGFMIGTFLMYLTMLAVSVGLFSSLLYLGTGLQNHRFVTAVMLFSPLFGVCWLLAMPGGQRPDVLGFPALLTILVIVLGAVSTLEFLVSGQATLVCRDHQGFPGQDRFYDLDCRAATGATTIGGTTESTYADPAIWYLYTGCRPVFAPGAENMDGHDLKAGFPLLGKGALVEMTANEKFPTGPQGLTVVCPQRATPGDPVCRVLMARNACAPSGERVSVCHLSRAEAAALSR